MNLLMLPMTLTTLTTRAEKAGPNAVTPAATLTFTSTLGATSLPSLFDTDTRWETFKKFCWNDDGTLTRNSVGAIDMPQRITGGEAKITLEMEHLTIDLSPMTLDNIVLTPNETGTCDVKLRINCKPSAEQIGQLYDRQQREYLVTASRKQADIEAEAEKAKEQAEKAETAGASGKVRQLKVAGGGQQQMSVD